MIVAASPTLNATINASPKPDSVQRYGAQQHDERRRAREEPGGDADAEDAARGDVLVAVVVVVAMLVVIVVVVVTVMVMAMRAADAGFGARRSRPRPRAVLRRASATGTAARGR